MYHTSDLEKSFIDKNVAPQEGEDSTVSKIDTSYKENHEVCSLAPALSPYTQFLHSASDYSTYPANVELAIKRAGSHRIRDYQKYPPKGYLSLFESKEEIKKYSTTAFFYFDFLEEGVYILLITFLLTGLFELITIMAYPWQELDSQTTTPFYYLSAFSVKYPSWVIFVKLFLTIVNIMAVKVYSGFKENARIRRYLQENHISQNYFSVFVQGLPKELNLKKFYEFMNPHLDGDAKGKIKKIIMLQDNTDKRNLMNRRRSTYVKTLDNDESQKKQLNIELQELDQEIESEDKLLSDNKKFNGSLILVLEDTYTTMELLQKWNAWTLPQRLKYRLFKGVLQREYLKEFEFEGQHIHIEKVGEPIDVEWSNTGKSQTNIFIRGLIASVVTWGTVSIYPIIKFSYLEKEKPKIQVDANNIMGAIWYFTPYICSIIFINLFIILTINFLSMFSGLRRKSDVEKRKIEMKVAFNFISYGLLIAAKAFIDSLQDGARNFMPNDSEFKKNELIAKQSFTAQVPTLMMYFIFLPQILEILDFEFLFKWARIKFYLSGNRVSKLSQGELDDIMKPVYFDFSTRVSNVGQIVFMSLATAPIFPFSPLLGMLALGAASITDRYLIIRRSSDWKLVGSNLGVFFSRAYNYNFIVQILGTLLFLRFDEQTSESALTQVFMILVFSVLGFLFSKYFSPAVKKRAIEGLEMDNTEYENEKDRFKMTYEELHEDFLMNAR